MGPLTLDLTGLTEAGVGAPGTAPARARAGARSPLRALVSSRVAPRVVVSVVSARLGAGARSCRSRAGRERAWAGFAALLALAGCRSAVREVTRPSLPAPNREVGACADPARDGVVGTTPRLERFEDRDLDGDGTPELVVVDRSQCSEEGNCHWNLFAADGAAGCARYLGTIAGVGMQPLALSGDRGFRDVRAWWRLGRSERMLLERYRFRHGGYRVIEALLCRRVEGRAVACDPASR
jgi:hypothetical protein